MTPTSSELVETVREALNRSYDDSQLATSYSNAALAALTDLASRLAKYERVVEEAKRISNYGATEPMARGVALAARPHLVEALDALNEEA